MKILRSSKIPKWIFEDVAICNDCECDFQSKNYKSEYMYVVLDEEYNVVSFCPKCFKNRKFSKK